MNVCEKNKRCAAPSVAKRRHRSLADTTLLNGENKEGANLKTDRMRQPSKKGAQEGRKTPWLAPVTLIRFANELAECQVF